MDSTPKDAIGMLTKDHKRVKDMFERFESLSDRSKASKKKLADEICQALSVHTQIEEEIFYPAARDAVDDQDMMDEALVEHGSAKDLIAQLQGLDPDDDLYDATVKVLSEQVDHHVEEEEDEMFSKLRKTDLDLVALGEQMNVRRKQLGAAGFSG